MPFRPRSVSVRHGDRLLTTGPAHYTGVPQLARYLSRKYADGQCMVTWANHGFYLDKAPVMQAAVPVLASAPPRRREASLAALTQDKRTVLEFNIDVAKALIVMASIVYERDNEYVRLASKYPESGAASLLRSEEPMVRVYALGSCIPAC
jgi:hypothetical protein